MKKVLGLTVILLIIGLVGAAVVSAAGTDVISSASITADPAVFAKTLGEDGTWIVIPTTDMTYNQELVIAGTFHDKGDSNNPLLRKVEACKTAGEDHKVVERYTITAPQFTIKSPNTLFAGGTLVGDVYVNANGFTVSDATIKGNVYFAKKEYQDSFKTEDGAKVTGTTAVKPDVDIIASASISDDPAVFAKALGKDGNWIVAATKDLNFNSELVIAGTFHNKGDSSRDLYRKLAPYDQDENHNLTERYTITAPQFTVKSPNTKFQGGIYVGNVYVEANGFTISDATVKGNVYFAKEEYKDSFSTEKGGKVTGTIAVK